MRVVLRLLAVVLILMMVVPLSAQDEPAEVTGSGDLAELLRFVPDTPDARQSISYGDYRAAEAARGYEPVITSFADFDNPDLDVSSRLWSSSQPNGGIEMNYLAAFGEMPQLIGVEFFQIDRSLVWGEPPNQGILLQGNFDEDAVRAAHEAREFTESEIKGAPLWCSADGCDQGLTTNLRDRQLADLFGGDLGRRFPRALVGDIFFGAGLDTTLEQMANAGIEGINSLADNPAYQAALAALDGDHFLRSAQFASPADFPPFDARLILGERATEETIRQLMEQFGDLSEGLPLYSLAVFADIVDAENERAVVGLVYLDEASAVSAGERAVALINVLPSFASNLPWTEILSNRGATIEAPTVYYDEATDQYVTLITLSKPKPSNEPAENGLYYVSGLLYRTLLEGYVRRDLTWLQTTLGE